MRVRRRVFGPDAEVAGAPGDPVRLAAPAAMDDPVVDRQARLEGGHRLRRELVLPSCDEAHAGCDDLEHEKTLTGAALPATSEKRHALVLSESDREDDVCLTLRVV